MWQIIECKTNPNCEMISECDKKIDCTTAMEQAEGFIRYICGLSPCKYSKGWKSIDRVSEYGDKTDFVETSEFSNEPIKHFMHNCNLTTCRYNENGKCTNEEKRKECVEVSRKVLCEDERLLH